MAKPAPPRPCDPVECPKCGSEDTWLMFAPRQHFRHASGYTESANSSHCGDGEHFDRGCRTCQYGWWTAA